MYYLDRSEEGSPKVIAAHEWDGYEEYLEKAKKWAMMVCGRSLFCLLPMARQI